MILNFDLIGFISAFWILIIIGSYFIYKYYRDSKEDELKLYYLNELDGVMTALEKEEEHNDKLQKTVHQLTNEIHRVDEHLVELNEYIDSLTISNIITQFAMSDGFEIDTVYDTVTGRETVCEPYKKDNPQLPLEYMIDVSLDDDLVYSVVVPKTVFSAIKRMLRAKVEHQGATHLTQSERKYHSDIMGKPVRRMPATIPHHPVADVPPAGFDPMHVKGPTLNPALDEIMAKLSQIPQNEGSGTNGK